MALIDLKNATIQLVDGSVPPKFVNVQLGGGTLEYTEKRNVEVVKRRGELDTVRLGDEEAMDVSFQFVWETLTQEDPGEPPTIEDVLKHRGNAADWKSVSTDPEAPFAVHIAVTFEPPIIPGVCEPFGPGKTFQTVWLEEFHYSELAHSMADAAVDCKGICNRVEAGQVTG